jgi:integral membrane protein (TIGR01906 family)
MTNLMNRMLKWVLVLLTPILLLLGSVQLLTTDAYLIFEYGKASFPPDTFGFTPQERFNLASSAIHYVRAHLPEYTLSRQLLNSMPVYKPREVAHMADVRAVFQVVFRVWQTTLSLLLLVGFILWQKRQWQTLRFAIQGGGLLTAGVILLIGLFAIFAWQSWFSTFHLFFFKPGSWLFSYSDTLIRLFPVKFWVDATLTISFMSFIGGLLLIGIGWRWQKVVDKPLS